MKFFSEGKRSEVPVPASLKAGNSRSGDFQEELEALHSVCRSNLRSYDADLIERAFVFSRDAHEGQIRHSKEPYFRHPVAVAMIVAQEIPLDDVSVAAALLHDVLEDCEQVGYEDIAARFGIVIADIVDGATKISNILKSREVTKAENYRKLLVSMINDIRVILVKFADRLHNMRTLEYVKKEKQQRIARETLEIYAPLAHRLGLGRLKWELEDLCFKYLHETEYRQLKEQIMQKRRDRETYIARFSKPIGHEMTKLGLRYDISGRPKHMYSIYKKMVERHKSIDEIYDLFAVRIILDTDEVKDCYLAYAVVCELYTPIPERYKNYIALPKTNGYKSIHTTVIGPNGKMVEVQIRTRQMHEIAEKGIAAHWAYKESTLNKQSGYDKWLHNVRDLLETPVPASNEEEGASQLIDSFKRNLYQEEIVVFTPKGDLIVLPRDATPVDFAFEIHSEVGIHTIGAKVNGRIVPLNRRLRSGDQVEIITSRNQFLSSDWEQFVITNKARNAIRRFLNEQSKATIQKGREKWEKKAKKLKQRVTDEQLARVAAVLKFQSLNKMFLALGDDEIDVENIADFLAAPEPRVDAPLSSPASQKEVFEQFANRVRTEQGVLIEGSQSPIQYEYARCCSPLPGDEVIGFVTQGRGIKIHRRSCRNILRLLGDQASGADSMRNRLVEISWPKNAENEYLGGIRIEGEDRPGILNEIAVTISGYQNTNIRSVNIETNQSAFHGSVLVSVKDLEHLQRLIERVRKVRGVAIAERYVEVA